MWSNASAPNPLMDARMNIGVMSLGFQADPLGGFGPLEAPGVIRELHWHPKAAEWALVLNGTCYTTLMDPQVG